MKIKQKIVAATVLLSATTGLFASSVQAEVAASVGASNMYYWRGFDLGGGAALIADVHASSNGFTAGLWTSSGDGTLGTEYDIYGGYAGKAGDFIYGLNLVTYNYANPKTASHKAINPGDYVEAIPFIGYGPFKLTYYDAVAAKVAPLNNKDYSFVTAELNFTQFAFKYGQHMTKDGSGLDGVSFLDSTYKFNEKLSFTLGKIIDNGRNNSAPKDAHLVVNLTLPIQ